MARRAHAPTRSRALRRALRLAAVLVASVSAGVLVLAGSALLPAARVNANIGADARALAAEDPAHRWLGNTQSRDDFTDELVLNLAMIDPGRPVTSTLGSEFYQSPDRDELNPARSLVERVEGGEAPNNSYRHYWFGTTALVRLWALVTTYMTWRLGNAALLGALLLVALVTAWRRAGAWLAITLGVVALLADPVLVSGALQFSPVAYVALSGVVAALWLAPGRPTARFDLELFVALGVATAYFDLLTAPLLTWGIPLVALAACELARNRSVSLALIVRSGLAWALGWVGMWAARLAITEVFIAPGAFAEIANTVAFRAGGATATGGAPVALAERWAVVLNNVYHLIPEAMWPADPQVLAASLVPAAIIGALLLVWALAAWRVGVSKGAPRRTWPLALVVLAPVGWYVLATEHSFTHAFFTYRALLVAVAAGMVWFGYTLRWRLTKPGAGTSHSGRGV